MIMIIIITKPLWCHHNNRFSDGQCQQLTWLDVIMLQPGTKNGNAPSNYILIDYSVCTWYKGVLFDRRKMVSIITHKE